MAWYNASWSYRVKITALNTRVDADLTDFPVYVNLANLPAGFHTNVNQTDGRDIRITTSNGTTEVPVEVVFYNSSTDTGEVYFKGSLLNTTDVDFYIYYGNVGATMPTANSSFGSQNVWDANYEAVYHLGNGSTLSLADSTSNANDLTNFSATAVTGKVGGGANLGGSASLRKTSPTGVLNTIPTTLETWMRSTVSNQYQYIIQGTIYGGNSAIFSLAMHGANNRLYYFQNNVAREGTTAVSGGAWRHIALTVTNTTTANIYVDGADDSGANPASAWSLGSANIYLGGLDGTSNHFTGDVDEARFSSVVRSATWLSTQYKNQSDPATFFTIGSQEIDTVITTITGIVSITGLLSITL